MNSSVHQAGLPLDSFFGLPMPVLMSFLGTVIKYSNKSNLLVKGQRILVHSLQVQPIIAEKSKHQEL